MKIKLALPLLIAAVLPAATEFWETKPADQWTAKEIQRILTGSPWGRKVTIERAGGPGLPSSEIELPAKARGNAGDSNGIDDGAPVPGTGRPEFEGSSDLGNADIVLESALPVRQARGKDAVPGDDSAYIISVGGLPIAAGQTGERNLMQGAALSAKGREAVRPSRVVLTSAGRNLRITYYFPKDRPFAATDNDVDLSITANGYRVRTRFRIKDLNFHGKLEL